MRSFILVDSNTTIGGVEVLFIEMALKLAEKNNVYFLVKNNNSIYQTKLKEKKNVFFIESLQSIPVEYLSNIQLFKEKKHVLKQLDINVNYLVIAPYFKSFQYCMHIFGDNPNFKLVHLWAHHQNWINSKRVLTKNKIVKKKPVFKTDMYYYQKKLWNEMYKRNAHYYGGRIVVDMNNWYYSTNISVNEIPVLPIDIHQYREPDKMNLENKKSYKILWVGRFTFFKNKSIITISKTLETLSKKYEDVNFVFDIVGYGNKKDTKFVKNMVKSNQVAVNFLGTIDFSELSNLFSGYDIGIGMGLTVKKMAEAYLPAILIDSVDKTDIDKKMANWLIDTVEGDAGDGYYFSITNKKISYRKSLFTLLEEVIINPENLSVIAKKGREYVEEHYSLNNNIMNIIDIFEKSSFNGISYPIYRRNIFVRGFYKYGKIIKNMLKKFRK